MRKDTVINISVIIFRAACLVGGIVTALLHFYSIIAIIAGLALIIFDKQLLWKLNGAVIAFFAGLGAFIAVNLKIVAPLDLIMYTVLIGAGAYFIVLAAYLIVSSIMRKKGIACPVGKAVNKIASRRNIVIAALLVIGIIAPSVLWSVPNINFKVLFDNKPRMLWVHAPTTPNAGEFDISVHAWDAYERVSAMYNGRIEFDILSFSLDTYEQLDAAAVDCTLPESYEFQGRKNHINFRAAYMIRDEKDNGRADFKVSILTPGIHYICVRDISDEDTDIKRKIPFADCVFYSNPVVIYPDGGDKIYWGDIHTHSALSDGAGSAEHNAYYARYVAMLDYYALTDHSEIMYWQPSRYQKLMKSTNEANAPGKFAALNGIEWTNVQSGHYTLVFNGDEIIHYPKLKPGRWSEIDKLWQELDIYTDETGYKVLALPHHTTKRLYPQDWSLLNPKYVRYAEVTSTHGESLFQHHDPLNIQGMDAPPKNNTYGTSIMDALKMGHNLTLYASSDEHAGNPGHNLTHAGVNYGIHYPQTGWAVVTDKIFPGGITAVRASELSREAVFDGLYNTRMYANSDHGRPYVEFSINGVTVGDGSTVNLDSANETRTIRVLVGQDGSPAGSKLQSAASFVGDNYAPDWNATVEIFKNGELYEEIEINSPVKEIVIEDGSPVTGTSYDKCVSVDGKYYLNEFSDNTVDPSTLNTGGKDFYVLRIRTAGKRFTYAGAIWVEAQ
ncbi:MAG: DUF3604 domain-containing protein [Christensenellales bacterium]